MIIDCAPMFSCKIQRFQFFQRVVITAFAISCSPLWVTAGLNASFLNYLRLTILSLEHHKAREPQYYQILQAQSSNQGEEVVICGLHKLQAQQLDRDGFLPKKLSAFRLAFFALVPIPILADMKLKH